MQGRERNECEISDVAYDDFLPICWVRHNSKTGGPLRCRRAVVTSGRGSRRTFWFAGLYIQQ